MYRIYRKVPDPFQGDFEFCFKNSYFFEEFDKFHGSFPGVSLTMREVSHVWQSRGCGFETRLVHMPVMLVTNVHPDVIKANSPKGATFIFLSKEVFFYYSKVYKRFSN